ncbi:hypothetical protein ACIQZG_23795 [Lysinibacillus sp. NPDC096418]|uniref:hypothetical protein n=1 Tax=Lysinibacillus sp. NPDC096418 TaxID=3364138 RepID=UPI00382C0CDC
MKKIIFFVVSLSFMSVILFGCQSNDNNGHSDVNISKFSISKSSGFGKVNSDFFTVYKDKETLDIFKNAISNAVKREGIANMAEPKFDIKVIYTDGNKQGYHQWVGEKGQKSTLMNVNDTYTIYSISEEITNRLIGLVK